MPIDEQESVQDVMSDLKSDTGGVLQKSLVK